jgi:hypothetical protein
VTLSAVISIVSSLLAVARYFITYAQQRQWIDQGTAAVILKSLQESDDAIAGANKARAAMRDINTRDPSSILSNDDGFQRPGD